MPPARRVALAVALATAAVAAPVRAAAPPPAARAGGAVAAVDLTACATDRAVDPAAVRPWRGCPAGFPMPRYGATRTETPLPACAPVPGQNDRCETWSRTATQFGSVSGMVGSPKGDLLYVAGTGNRPDNGVTAITAAAFTSKGAPKWSVRAPTSLPTTATSLALARDGRRLYVGGYVTMRPNLNSLPFDLYYLLALDAATGRILWVGQYPGVGANVNRIFAVAVSPSGGQVYVTGTSQRLCSSCQIFPADWATVAYDSRNGKPLWNARYSGAAGGQNGGLALVVAPNGRNVYVTGYSERPTMQPTQLFDFATASYQANDGAQVWVRRYASGNQDIPTGVAVSPRGDTVYVAGTGADSGAAGASPGNYTAIAYAANGGLRWRSVYRDVAGTSNVMTAMALSPKGDRLVVTGQGQQQGSVLPAAAAAGSAAYSTVTFATSNGKRLWAASFAPNKEPGAGTAVTINPASGRVYVGGVLVNAAGLVSYVATVAYAGKNGAQDWVARYDLRDPLSVGANVPRGIVADPHGKAVYEAATLAPLAAASGQVSSGALLLGFQP
jgi:hypothetical protein